MAVVRHELLCLPVKYVCCWWQINSLSSREFLCVKIRWSFIETIIGTKRSRNSSYGSLINVKSKFIEFIFEILHALSALNEVAYIIKVVETMRYRTSFHMSITVFRKIIGWATNILFLWDNDKIWSSVSVNTIPTERLDIFCEILYTGFGVKSQSTSLMGKIASTFSKYRPF